MPGMWEPLLLPLTSLHLSEGEWRSYYTCTCTSMKSKWVVVCMKLQKLLQHTLYTLSLTHTEQQTVVATEVRREVINQDDLTASLFLSLDWPTSCVPLFSVQLMRDEEAVTHSRLVPTVTGSSGDRELRLVLPLDGFLKNTQYTAQLTSVSDEREVAAVGIITSECMCVVCCTISHL